MMIMMGMDRNNWIEYTYELEEEMVNYYVVSPNELS